MAKIIQYRREYLRRRYHKRRHEALEYLGGKCVDCGATSNLEFDHRDPAEKSFSVSSRFVGMTKEKLWAEIDKCDLRCTDCHKNKTARQRQEK